MKNLYVVLTLVAIFASVGLTVNAQNPDLEKVFGYRECNRDGNSVKVQILVNIKGLSKGKTVKLKEKIPAGYKAKVIEAYGSSAEATETNVNFTWKVLPQSDLFIIKYELIYPSAVTENVSISGNMSFMSDFGIKYVSVVTRDFSTDKDFTYAIRNIPVYKPGAIAVEEEEKPVVVNKPIVVEDAKIDENSPKPIPRTNVTDPKPEPVKTTVEEKPVVETKPQPEPVKTTVEEKPVVETKPQPEPVKTTVEENPVVSSGNSVSKTAGAVYYVQVGASASKLPSTYYDKYSFDRTVEENLENNMYKYLLGRFSTLKDANAYLAKVKTKGVACFVVAYIDGRRVTVKDALDITKK